MLTFLSFNLWAYMQKFMMLPAARRMDIRGNFVASHCSYNNCREHHKILWCFLYEIFFKVKVKCAHIKTRSWIIDFVAFQLKFFELSRRIVICRWEQCCGQSEHKSKGKIETPPQCVYLIIIDWSCECDRNCSQLTQPN